MICNLSCPQKNRGWFQNIPSGALFRVINRGALGVAHAFWKYVHLLLIAGMFVLPLPCNAQEQPDISKHSATTTDPNIPVDNLQVILRPLSKQELETERDRWLDLLQIKIREVGEMELKIKSQDQSKPVEKLGEQLVALRTEEAALVERTRVVIDALKAKGGDVQSTEQFLSAISDISETTDVVSYWAALRAEVTNWIGRDDGGRQLAKQFLFALIIMLVFWLLSKISGNIVARAIHRHPRTSLLLENFARRTTGGIVFVIGFLMAISALGVQVGPMMAALGAGGFIVGFALQETLGSFASGMMIMVYRPFDVDDYVEVAGVEGTVKEMSLVSTTLLTIDNKVLVIPNKKAWGDTIVNYTGKEHRRIDLVFGIGYDDDIQNAMKVLKDITSEHNLILEEPAVNIKVGELADSSVNLLCRPWVKTEDYWEVYWDLMQQVKERFDSERISIPYPQRDLHLYRESATE